jgi:hypothetical protein
LEGAQVRFLLMTGELHGIQVGAKGLWRIGSEDLKAYMVDADIVRLLSKSRHGNLTQSLDDLPLARIDSNTVEIRAEIPASD